METFRLSPQTTFDNILRSACTYWGVMLKDFAIYQIDTKTGKPVDLSQETQPVGKFLEDHAQTHNHKEAANTLEDNQN